LIRIYTNNELQVHETLLKLHLVIPNLGTLLILPFSVSKGGGDRIDT